MAADHKHVRGRRWLRRITSLMATFVVAGVAAGVGLGVTYAKWASEAVEGLHRSGSLSDYDERPVTADGAAGAAMNIVLVIGHPDGGADVMIMHLSADRDQMGLVAFPRDVVIPGTGGRKLGEYASSASMAQTTRVLEQATEVRMDHFVLVYENRFYQLIDLLGGIEVHNAAHFTAGGRTWPAGTLHLSTIDAMDYGQAVSETDAGDTARTARHVEVFRSLMVVLLRGRSWMAPGKVNRILADLPNQVTLDESFDAKEFVATVKDLHITPRDVLALTVPVTPHIQVGSCSIDSTVLRQITWALRSDRISIGSLSTAIRPIPTSVPHR